MSALVEVRDLSIRFPARHGAVAVVERGELTLARGETLGLVGESGSGKSLIGRAILGLLPPGAVATGEVRVDGVDMLAADARTLARVRGGVVATVFQDALIALNPSRTIGGHLADVWRAGGGDPAQARAASREVLEMAALTDPERVLASYPHELSGGMRQRALIAIALLRRPSVLVADEPTTALDRVVEADVLATLERLQEELGLAVLLISHDFSVIRRLAHRVAVLYAGQVCETGPAAELIGAPRHPYTRGLDAAVRSLAERTRPLAAIPGTVPPPREFPSGCRFASRCELADAICATPRPLVHEGDRRTWCHRVAEAQGLVAGGEERRDG